MTGKLDGKVALITGGSSGIGLATARRFIKEGAKVVIAARGKDALDAAVKDLGEKAMGVQADVSKLPDLDNLMAKIKKTHGHLDIVFANAGGSGAGPRPLEVFSEEDYQSVFDQNVNRAFYSSKVVGGSKGRRYHRANHICRQCQRIAGCDRLWSGQSGRSLLCADMDQ